ncbi:MAG: hypothetical protein ACFFDN_41300 [Candidatus Hodarchaeota archaeon]
MKETKKSGGEEESLEIGKIMKWARYWHLSGFVFTMSAFWLISYKYLVSIVGYNIVIVFLPFILFILYWAPKMIGVEREVSLLSRESLLQFGFQIVFLILICLDFLRIITIP